MGQYCFARWRLSSVVCLFARRSGGRHSTAGQSCYVPLGRHLVFTSFARYMLSHSQFCLCFCLSCELPEPSIGTTTLACSAMWRQDRSMLIQCSGDCGQHSIDQGFSFPNRQEFPMGLFQDFVRIGTTDWQT